MVRPINNADMLRLGVLAAEPTTKKSALLNSATKLISSAALDESIVHRCKKEVWEMKLLGCFFKNGFLGAAWSVPWTRS